MALDKFTKPHILLILLCLAAFAILAANLTNPLFWDDQYFILENSYVHSFDIVNIFTKNADAGAGIESQYYRPLSILTYAVDWALHQNKPFFYHLVNNLLHIANGVLLYLLLKKLLEKETLAIFTAAIFLLHPIHTNTIAYVSGRDSLLAAAFILLTLLLYPKHYLWSHLTFILALLSRETALVAPILILLTNYKAFHAHLKKIIPFFAVGAIYLLLRLTVLNFGQTQNLSGIKIPFFERIWTFLGILPQYLILIFAPNNLHFRVAQKRVSKSPLLSNLHQHKLPAR